MTAENFLESTIFAFVLIFISFILFLAVGIPSELILNSFEETTVFDVSPNWDGYNRILYLFSLEYIAICGPGLVGIGLLVLQVIRRQRRDVVEEEQYVYG